MFHSRIEPLTPFQQMLKRQTLRKRVWTRSETYLALCMLVAAYAIAVWRLPYVWIAALLIVPVWAFMQSYRMMGLMHRDGTMQHLLVTGMSASRIVSETALHNSIRALIPNSVFLFGLLVLTREFQFTFICASITLGLTALASQTAAVLAVSPATLLRSAARVLGVVLAGLLAGLLILAAPLVFAIVIAPRIDGFYFRTPAIFYAIAFGLPLLALIVAAVLTSRHSARQKPESPHPGLAERQARDLDERVEL